MKVSYSKRLALQIKNKHSLLNFSALTIIDKGFSFLMPVTILFLFKDKLLYNQIEYITSLAFLCLYCLDFGLGAYGYYGYKIAPDKVEFMSDFYSSFLTLNFIYLILFSLLSIFLYQHRILIICFAIRLLYLYCGLFITTYFRLRDEPSYAPICTITFSALTLVVVMIFFLAQKQISLILFFMPSFPLLVLVWFFYKKKRTILPRSFILLLKKSFLYSWPLLLNYTITALLSNFGKISGYHHFSTNDMTAFAFLQRLGQILGLVHTSVAGYYSKDFFMRSFQEIKVALWRYAWIMLACFGVVVLLSIFGMFFVLHTLQYIWISILMLVFSLCNAFSSLVELFFNRFNKTHLVLIVNLLYLASYFSTYYLIAKNTILTMSGIMAGSALFGLVASLLLLIYFLRSTKKYV